MDECPSGLRSQS